MARLFIVAAIVLQMLTVSARHLFCSGAAMRKDTLRKGSTLTLRVTRIRQAMRLVKKYGFDRGVLMMTRSQYDAARFAVQEACRVARFSNCPRSMEIDGARFRLSYTTLGRVFVCNARGERLLGSFYGAAWE